MQTDMNPGVRWSRSQPVSARRRARGFTLVELMVVVAIVAILASIALPSYQDSIRKSRRGQAKSDLVELAQGLERFHSVNGTYAGYVAPFAVSPRTATAGTQQYNLAVGNLSVTGFTLTATAFGAQVEDTCGNLGLTQTGAKSFTGASGTVAQCW